MKQPTSTVAAGTGLRIAEVRLAVLDVLKSSPHGLDDRAVVSAAIAALPPPKPSVVLVREVLVDCLDSRLLERVPGDLRRIRLTSVPTG